MPFCALGEPQAETRAFALHARPFGGGCLLDRRDWLLGRTRDACGAIHVRCGRTDGQPSGCPRPHSRPMSPRSDRTLSRVRVAHLGPTATSSWPLASAMARPVGGIGGRPAPVHWSRQGRQPVRVDFNVHCGRLVLAGRWRAKALTPSGPTRTPPHTLSHTHHRRSQLSGRKMGWMPGRAVVSLWALALALVRAALICENKYK